MHILNTPLLMDSIKPVKFDTITEYAESLGFQPQHPLVTVNDLAEMPADRIGRKRFGFYCVLLKEHYNGKLTYGRGEYEYQAGTMLFTSPGQVIGIDIEGDDNHSKGYFLMFHPDFLYDTSLIQRMRHYFFFAYDVNGALQMSESEKEIVVNLFRCIRAELDSPADKHTPSITASYIETLLNYCLRFYDRQFASRKTDNTNIISRLEMVLDEYYAKEKAVDSGLPSVHYCARCVNLSPNYFGDLIKKETGKTAQNYIHTYIVNKAKRHLISTSMNISEVAFHLGFQYPHHFSRIFKRLTGQTPNEYRMNHKR